MNVKYLVCVSAIVTSTAGLAMQLSKAALNASVAGNAAYESKNYERLLNNDDGSVTILEPRFGSPDHQNLVLSSSSSLSGICKLFGYSNYVDQSAQSSTINVNKVDIGSDGRFGGYDGGYPYMINSLACTNNQNASANSRGTLETNDDGSITVSVPRIGFFAGKILPISSRSSLDGVCALFGLGSYISRSAQSERMDTQTVTINGNGKFSGYDGDYYFLDSLMCEKGKAVETPTQQAATTPPILLPPSKKPSHNRKVTVPPTAAPAPAPAPAPVVAAPAPLPILSQSCQCFKGNGWSAPWHVQVRKYPCAPTIEKQAAPTFGTQDWCESNMGIRGQSETCAPLDGSASCRCVKGDGWRTPWYIEVKHQACAPSEIETQHEGYGDLETCQSMGIANQAQTCGLGN